MAIVTSCCCGQSLRNGSFAAGIYSLGLYTVAITLAAFHVITDLDDPVLFGLNVMLLVCSGFCVPSSVLLLIGLCVDSKLLLLPWILCTTVTTLIYVILSLYLLCDTKFHPLLLVFFLVDLVICSLNVYCLLCVISQYQEYLAGRGHPGQTTFSRAVPSVRLHTLQTRQETSKFITTPIKGHLGVNSPNNLQPDVSWREDSTSKSNICSELSSVSEEHIVQDISKAAGEHSNQEIPGTKNARSDASLHNIVIVSSGSPTQLLETNHKNTSFDTNNSDLMELD
ncbi:uncharacterized protein LOC143230808 isoform X1 [Tachypleus tridentatus]|uniref:uncharacterized protein LOC143230808 isoform X1 n=1 Tax=Tachypleus tridentatus TaxID=6853 RepID=UPI003FD000C8